jgi:hypothetical protein
MRKKPTNDNAVMDSFYRALNRELVQDANYDNPEQAHMEIFKYIETYFLPVHFIASKFVGDFYQLNKK